MELLIPLDSQSEKPLYEQIYGYIKEEIRRKNLRTGMRLPSTRVLADHLKVSRSTTQMAYEQLLAEGYVETIPCRGYFVAGMEELLEVHQEPSGDLFAEPERKSEDLKIDFSPRGIDLNSFPYHIWRKLSRQTFAEDNREMFLSGTPQGEWGLREAIRDYLHAARGVECNPEQIIVGAGNEYLLMLLYQILGRNQTIAMENPTYKQAYRVFCSLGSQVVPVEMDAFGMKIPALEQSGADLAYVMPSHQFPTGIVMPVKRRQELLRWAGEKKGRFLVEDDYDSEFRYKGKPIPALQGMDQAGKVIYLGTFSRAIAPAIRVGYLVLPKQLLKIYLERMSFYSSTVSRIDQNIIYQFLSQGHFERHLNRTRAGYKAKHDVLLTELKPLEKDFLVRGEYAGTHILLTHKRGWTETKLVEAAAQKKVRVYGLSSYIIQPVNHIQESTVLLGYANLSEEEIRQGVLLLTECWCADRK